MNYQSLRQKLLSETAQLVTWKIKKVLATAPEYPYQAVFAVRQYREKLLLCVVREIYGYYRITQDENPNPLKMLHFCLAEEAQIESLVQRSAVQILEEDAHWMEDIQATSTGHYV